jgi:tetratricopeptide (TPR) repeat protein
VSVVGAIAPKLEQAEIERTKHKPTERLDAYDYFLRGMANLYMANLYQATRDSNSEALRLYHKAIELDPDFALAHGWAAICYTQRKSNGWPTDRAHEIAETARLVRRAVALGRDDAVALATGGFALGYVVNDAKGGSTFIDQALGLNPNLAAAWYSSGWVRNWLGQPDLAIEHFAHAMRLSPLDPVMGLMQVGTAHAHFFANRYCDASAWAEMVLREHSFLHGALRIATATAALAGRVEEARKLCTRLQQLDPALRVSNLRDVLGPYEPEALAKYEAGLRKAGLPE